MGRKLRPFSLWHLVVLSGLDSPLVREGARKPGPKGVEVTPRDLKLAASVCALRYPEWRGDARLSAWDRIWRLSHREGWLRELRSWAAYREDFASYPDFDVQEPHRSAAVKSAVPIRLNPPPGPVWKVTLVASTLGMPPDQVWDLPIGVVEWYAACARRLRGELVDFTTEAHREFREEFKRRFGGGK